MFDYPLFKAKTNSIEWVEGSLVGHGSASSILYPNKESVSGHTAVLVFEHTICRNTGRHDANGIYLYENDFVEIDGNSLYLLTYDEELLKFTLIDCDEFSSSLGSESPIEYLDGEFFIVGNKIDNPAYENEWNEENNAHREGGENKE